MSRLVLKLAAGLALFGVARVALAGDVTSINSVVVQERVFNDFPNSTLTSVDNFPTLVSFTETDYGTGGFANRHDAVFSADDTNPFLLQTSDAFHIAFDIMLDAGSVSPRKEAGIRFNFNGFDGLFIVTSDGESAAFGGVLPFFSFGGSAYTPGTVARMEVIYTPDDDGDANDGDASTIEYILNGVSSGPLNFGNLENGFIPDTQIAVYVQSQPDSGNPSDFVIAEFSNFSIVPEPATGLLALLGVALLRRR